MTDEGQAAQAQDAAETDVERLAREVVRVINAGPEGEREILRELAVAVLRDEVQIVSNPRPADAPTLGTFNFFGIGIPLVLMGAVLIFLFPPIGLVCLAAAALTFVCGFGVVLFSRGKAS
ncbi:MAG TPA: hypothetical protein VL403_17325 [Candidatus Kryptonia bacterium]|nr:hypothetical protein [Candidatus Kryptonia bacterium]